MLGRTAGQLFWMARYMERAENMARHIEVAYRMALTPSAGEGHREEWQSTLTTTGCWDGYFKTHEEVTGRSVAEYLLFDAENPNSIFSILGFARDNARAVRTSITREMWEAINATWIEMSQRQREKLVMRSLPETLEWVKQRASQFRGALMGTLLRNDGYYFCQLGTYMERADNTARILDTKYYVLLPKDESVGGEIDTYQWQAILRSVSAHRSYRWVYGDTPKPWEVADFLILREEMPRSLAHCYRHIDEALRSLKKLYGTKHECQSSARRTYKSLKEGDLDTIYQSGLHEFLTDNIARTNALAISAGEAYNFYN